MYQFLTYIFLGLFGISTATAVYEHHERVAATKSFRQLEISMLDSNDLIQSNVVQIRQLNYDMQKLSNKKNDLEMMLASRNQEAEVLAQQVIQWKGKYFQVKDATQTVVQTGTVDKPAPVTPECSTCLKQARLRVDFDETKDYMQVKGFTVTNPSYAEVDVKWTRPLKLSLVLAKDHTTNKFVAYSKSGDSDFVPSNIKILMDDSIYETPWYKRISFGTEFGASGHSTAFSANVKYDLKRLSIGPTWIGYDKLGAITHHFGVAASFYPWR